MSSSLPSLNAGQLELGAGVTGTHLHKIDQAPVGVGGRLFWNFSREAALDAEVTRYPGKTSVLAGAKLGLRRERFGVFGKTRAGIWHFSRSYTAVDVGGVVEYYPSPRTAIRIDAGDTILYYGGPALGTVHNFQPGIGFSYRF
jgi:hypothetical protein